MLGFALWPAGKRDARPLHAQGPDIGLPVGWIVQGGQDMVEQVFDIEAKVGEIATSFV